MLISLRVTEEFTFRAEGVYQFIIVIDIHIKQAIDESPFNISNQMFSGDIQVSHKLRHWDAPGRSTQRFHEGNNFHLFFFLIIDDSIN
ncbi:TPA: hypothetical protein MHW76_01645 [Klebsiella pneumoniae]|nr:hypothetical protein B6I87_26060 [Klebsiella quasipneumoniae]HBX3400642.1 hypothetical protein [Klebsiella pneumoniae]HBX7580574.1 hypothetical protein [Klebsiella pneumoniae]